MEALQRSQDSFERNLYSSTAEMRDSRQKFLPLQLDAALGQAGERHLLIWASLPPSPSQILLRPLLRMHLAPTRRHLPPLHILQAHWLPLPADLAARITARLSLNVQNLPSDWSLVALSANADENSQKAADRIDPHLCPHPCFARSLVSW